MKDIGSKGNTIITRLLYFLVQCLWVPTAIAAGLSSLAIAPVWWIVTSRNIMDLYIKTANNIDHFIDENLCTGK